MVNLAVFGTGEMGSYVIREQANKADKVFVRSRKSPEEVRRLFPSVPNLVVAETDEAAMRYADFACFCLLTEVVEDVMRRALPYAKKGAIISGQTSVKEPEVNAFNAVTRKHPELGLQLVTIHTMCRPKVSNASEEILAIIPYNSSEEAVLRTRDFYGGLSRRIVMFANPEEHDKRVADTQANTSRTFLTTASAFADRGCFPGVNLSYNDPLDELKFALAMRAADQGVDVYKGIQFLNTLGRKIALGSAQTERDLFSLIVRGDYEGYMKKVLDAKEIVFGDMKSPILRESDLKQFGGVSSVKLNSHFSLINWVVECAELGLKPFEDMKKATTPMFSSLVALASYLFNTPGELEKAIIAPFGDPGMRADDLAFHDRYQLWANAVVYGNSAGYDALHKEMKDKLPPEVLRPAVEKSRLVTTVCREALRRELGIG